MIHGLSEDLQVEFNTRKRAIKEMAVCFCRFFLPGNLSSLVIVS